MYNNNKKNIMNELVKIRKSTTTGNPVANVISSREIANATGKNHKEVMRDIRSMCMQAEIEILSAQTCAYSDSSEVLVIESEYNVEFGNEGHTRKSKEYLLNEIAAEVLALGYDVKKRIAILKLVKKMKQVIEQQLSLPLTSTTMTIAEVAKTFKTSSYEINQLLRKNKYFKPNYKPYEKWINQGLFVYRLYNPKYSAKQLRVTGDKGISAIQQLLSPNKQLVQIQSITVNQPVIATPSQNVINENRLTNIETALSSMFKYILLCKSGKNNRIEEENYLTVLRKFQAETEKIKSIGNL
jgi:phage regulator Rha-like protein